MIVEKEDAAMRLARAICSDILLYNESRVTALPPEQRGAAIAEAVAEGRQLYAGRVAPALLALFDTALEALVAKRLGISVSDIPAAPLPHPAVPEPGAMAPLYGVPPHASARGFEEPPPRRREKPTNYVPLIAAILFLALAAACWYFLPRLHW